MEKVYDKYYEVRYPDGRPRLWTVSRDEAIRFSDIAFKAEGEACLVTEVDRRQ